MLVHFFQVPTKRCLPVLVLLVSIVAIFTITTQIFQFRLSPFAHVYNNSRPAVNALQTLNCNLPSDKSRTAYQNETKIVSLAQSTLGCKSVRGDSGEGVERHDGHPDSLTRQEDTTPDVCKVKTAAPLFEPVDLMKEGPFEYLSNYKNPCLRSSGTLPPIACLPYVYLVGSAKCGTTDIYSRIMAHPDVARPKCKEPHWLSRGRFQNGEERTLMNYSDIYFAVAAYEIYRSVDTNNYHNKITGDFSASTIFDNHYWRALPENADRDEPKHTNADYIHHVNPDTKIIVMLREPINRLYSDYWYFLPRRTANFTKLERFHKLVQANLERWNSCLKYRPFRYCLYTRHVDPDKPRARIKIGMYSEHIADLLRVFPREQLLVIKMEEYSLDPSTSMQQVFQFLNISQLSASQMTRIGDPRYKNQNPTHSNAAPMWEATKRLLVNFYKPYNEKLGELLADERFNYNYMYRSVKAVRRT